MKDFQSRIDSLSPDQRALLAHRLREKSSASRLIAYVVPDDDAPVMPDPSVLRDFLKERLPDYMVPSAFVVLDELPRMPNGKVNYRQLPEPDENRKGEGEGFAMPRNETEEILTRIWADVLGYERVGIHDNFFEIGGDSILSIQIIARARQAGFRLSPAQLIQYQTIASLAPVVAYKTAIRPAENIVEGPAVLTPIQHWFFEQPLQEPHYWNQQLWLEGPVDIDSNRVRGALEAVVRHHDALRLRFRKDASGWHAWYTAPNESVVVNTVDLSGFSEVDQSQILEEDAARQQSCMNLSEGPLLQATHFNRGEGKAGLLVISIHHILVDPVSWRIILEDFTSAYDQLAHGVSIELPFATTSYKQWSERLADYAQLESVRSERDYWLASSEVVTAQIPRDKQGFFTEISARTITTLLSVEETNALLKDVPGVSSIQPEDLLLASLAQTLSEWTGNPVLRIGLERHGREEVEEDLDLSRTVGWFTSFFPIVLSLEAGSGPDIALKSIKEQVRGIPGRGIGYGLLRYLRDDPALTHALRLLPQPEVIFNYTGRADLTISERTAFRPVGTLSAARSPQNRRGHLLEINAYVSSNQLHIDWTYSENIHETTTIERVSGRNVGILQELIAHCLSGEAGGYTPSDFPEAGLDQEALDRLLDRFVS